MKHRASEWKIIVELIGCTGYKSDKIPDASQQIEILKYNLNQFPIQEFALLLLETLINADQLKEAIELMDHFPKRSAFIKTESRFISLMNIMRHCFEKIAETRRTGNHLESPKQEFIPDKELVASFRRLLIRFMGENLMVKDNIGRIGAGLLL